jgi:hypothetical protein
LVVGRKKKEVSRKKEYNRYLKITVCEELTINSRQKISIGSFEPT